MDRLEIEDAVAALASKEFSENEFFFEMMAAFDAPQSTISKVRSGSTGASDVIGGAIWKPHIHYAYRPTLPPRELLAELQASKKNKSQKVRFLFATDGREIALEDKKTGELHIFCVSDLLEHVDLLLPVSGIEIYHPPEEKIVDFKATKRLAKLHDALVRENPEWGTEERSHDMNLFMTRVVFCLFAEDTGIFEDDVFTRLLVEYGGRDADKVTELLAQMFAVMDTPAAQRQEHDHLSKLPYVNGGLFAGSHDVPHFSKAAWNRLEEAAALDWKEINPDIFGSMMQAVASPEKRHELGMHYTSEVNIRKVLDPLFLDELNEQLEQADTVKKVERLLHRISHIRVFDPACGSGNFLVIAYKELRRLEMRAIAKKWEIIGAKNMELLERLPLRNFYGIEMQEVLGIYQAVLPLPSGANIICANSLRVDWLTVCPPSERHETYIAGNPPFLGFGMQTPEQKADLKAVLAGRIDQTRRLDFVSGWFMQASDFLRRGSARGVGLVSTNSICQGDSVPTLWPHLLAGGVHIRFAHKDFKWSNHAGKSAGVTCSIVGLSVQNTPEGSRKLVVGDQVSAAPLIGPYLVAGSDEVVLGRRVPLCVSLPKIDLGNMARDGGHLILSPQERAELLNHYPQADELVRRLVGSQEFIRGIERYCLWITDEQLEVAKHIPPVAARIEGVRAMREASKAASTRSWAERPYRFVQIQATAQRHTIVVPAISSSRRSFLPVGVIGANTVPTHKVYCLHDAPLWAMALMSSKLHREWTATVCGRMRTDFSYSNTLGWNTFPVPTLTEQDKTDLNATAESVLRAREKNPGRTIAQLYDPDHMPENLREAHQANDEVLEKIYIGRTFRNDSERLEHLFARYSAMIEEENRQG